jgi:hypothetical protein
MLDRRARKREEAHRPRRRLRRYRGSVDDRTTERTAAVRELLIYCLEREGAGNREAGVHSDKAGSLQRLAGELRALADGDPRLERLVPYAFGPEQWSLANFTSGPFRLNGELTADGDLASIGVGSYLDALFEELHRTYVAPVRPIIPAQ